MIAKTTPIKHKLTCRTVNADNVTTLSSVELFRFSRDNLSSWYHLASGLQHAGDGEAAVPGRKHCGFRPSQRRLTDRERCRRYHASRFVNHHRHRVDQEHGLALPLTRYKFITSPTEQLTTLDEFEAAVVAVLSATAATNATIKSEPGEPNLGWDPSRNQWGSPIRDRFPQAIKESAEEATREYFQKGATCFEEGQHMQATEHLCSGIICSIAAIAASKGGLTPPGR